MINVLSERDDEDVPMFVVRIYLKHPRRGKAKDVAKFPTNRLSIDLRKNRGGFCNNRRFI